MARESVGGEEFDALTKKVVSLVTREYALSGNQVHELASLLERLATHRIIEEHIRQYRRRTEAE